MNIGNEINYGSPGYLMAFTITDIQPSKIGYEITGVINNEEGHFFNITKEVYETFENEGEVFFVDTYGGYNEIRKEI